jgi:S-adenosylmethionine:tRNA ribosyltransferase-isomerase
VASRPTSDFQYEYPPEAIAQRPLEDRAASRMLLVDRATGGLRHLHIRDLPTLIEPGDAIVVNTSRVIPARLTGTRENGREAELLLIHAEDDGSWLAMVHPGGKLKTGRTIRFGSDTRATVTEVMRGGLRRVRFSGGVDPRALMDLYGETPLPPYIHRKPDARDVDRYQTVFAKVEGSVAAPTAGLHFTDELLDAIRERGARIADIVLHVGPGTFKPVETDNPTEHPMHPEWYEVPTAAAEIIEQAKASGCRVWGIGTTAVRTLETTGGRAASGWTDLFIYPPYTFTVVDAMLTNFHLPRSTLLMLVAAFAGFEPTMNAYRSAVADGYRLYSYGDAMAIV